MTTGQRQEAAAEQTTPNRTIKLTDPRALRALAHPLRMHLLGVLRREGSLTATQCGERVGESPASCSFHLRQLARYGLVEEAGGGHGRNRPWRATAWSTSWPSYSEDQDVAAGADLLSRTVASRYFERFVGWLERRRSDAPEWQEAATMGDVSLYLTADELAEVDRELDAIADRYTARTRNPSLRPPGARRVVFVKLAFPDDD
jgi:predicted ArsR family transcriptional regulator